MPPPPSHEPDNSSSSKLNQSNVAKLKDIAHTLLAQRKKLPIYPAKDALIAQIKKEETVVIVGETGSGKTTQIPQFLYEAGLVSYDRGVVAITQPRRVAATSLAARVAEEVGTKLGNRVGYCVRFDDTSSINKTLIRFVTDGMLLREVLSDQLLQRYAVIILDEAHERTLRTDVLFGLVKSIQIARKSSPNPLKIIVMSATLDAERFSQYFNAAPIIYVAGRQFPVSIRYPLESQEDYLDASLVTTLQIHEEQREGDVLIFLSGQEDIENLEKLLNEHSSSLGLKVCPLFAALPAAQQAQIFQPAPKGYRKVILATNIAETSVTIPGIRFVIDCGVAKLRGFDTRVGMESLLIKPISKSSARQRTGRAGREGPGICFRLYTEKTFLSLREDTEPEIKRCNLASVLLSLKASGVDDVLSFDFLDPPDRFALLRALEQLYAVEALNDQGGLTALGKRMAEFPLEPTLAKVLFQSELLKCSAEVIDVIALLNVETIFYAPHEQRERALEARLKFASSHGDHLTLLNVLDAYLAKQREEPQKLNDWCKEHFINARSMKYILNVRKQLQQVCARISLDPKTTQRPQHEQVLLKSFLAGMLQNTALLHPDGKFHALTGQRQVVQIHPLSTLFGRRNPAKAIMFNEMVFTTKPYARCVSSIEPEWLLEMAPKYFGRLKFQPKSADPS